MALTAEAKRARRDLIAKRVASRRRSDAMHEMWRRRRAELQEFVDDGRAHDAGSPDFDLVELPDTLA